LVQKLGGPSKVLWPGPTDITSEESVTKALDLTLKTFGHIDIVVNAAGVPWVQKVRSAVLSCVLFISNCNNRRSARMASPRIWISSDVSSRST